MQTLLLRVLSISLTVATLGCTREDSKRPPRDAVQPEKSQQQASSRLSGDLVIFHAGSLAVPLRAVSDLFRKENPGITVKAEAAGSLDSARKISDLGRPCDVLASADYQVVNDLLIPNYADYNICFAGNEMGLAYTPKSKYAGEINAGNWPEIVSRRTPCWAAPIRTATPADIARSWFSSWPRSNMESRAWPIACWLKTGNLSARRRRICWPCWKAAKSIICSSTVR